MKKVCDKKAYASDHHKMMDIRVTNFALILAIIFAFLQLSISTGHGFGFSGNRSKSAINAKSARNEQEQFFTQPLDHFNPRDTRKLKQRYFVNSVSPIPKNANILLQIGGESPVEGTFYVYPRLSEIVFPGEPMVVVALEHRFYGKSVPEEGISWSNIRFLKSRQALKDIENFLKSFKETNQLWSGSKAVVIGGSYAGNLAAWFRIHHSSSAVAAVASSAPLLARMDFSQFFGEIAMQLGSDCVARIHIALKEFDMLVLSQYGRSQLGAMFHVPVSWFTSSDPYLVTIFLNNYIASPIGIILQNDINHAKSKYFCYWLSISQQTGSALLQVIALFLHPSKISYRKVKVQDWQYLLWPYQICNEFGYFHTSPLENSLFGKRIPLSFFIKFCQANFGQKYTLTEITKEVSRTNLFYGGQHPYTLTNVVFVNGDSDPWKSLFVQSAYKDSIKLVTVRGGTHIQDLLANVQTPAVVQARMEAFNALAMLVRGSNK